MTLDQGSLCQVCHCSDTTRFGLSAFAVAFPAAAALSRISQSSLGRLENKAQRDLSFFNQGDHDRELIVFSSEAACAVDRVDDPCSRAGLRHLSKQLHCFFRTQRIVGKSGVQMLENYYLGLAIGISGDVGRSVANDLETGIFFLDVLAR